MSKVLSDAAIVIPEEAGNSTSRNPALSPAYVTAIAEHMIGRLDKQANAAYDQLIKSSNWLSASILTVNAGGAITALNLTEQTGHLLREEVIFGTGVVLIILNVVVIQALVALSAQPTENYLAFWKRAQISGQVSAEEEIEVTRPIRRVARFSWTAPALGWIAGSCFVVGSVALGTDLTEQAQARAVQCSVLRNDMLSFVPQKQNSAEVYKVLHCGPSDRTS